MLCRLTTLADVYFEYVRQSSDEKQRKQTKSIPSQRQDNEETKSKVPINVVRTFEEDQSAKHPGRPVFAEMILEIEKNWARGQSVGILIWDPSRLARNTLDGGRITHLLQSGVIHHIQTFDRDYIPSDSTQMLMGEFCESTEYSRKLGKAIKRGYRQKIRDGWYPYNRVTLGYKQTPYDEYNPDREKIIPDPLHYDKAVHIYRLALTRRYSLSDLCRISNDLDMKNPKTGKPWSYNTIRNLVLSPLFAGYFYATNSDGVRELFQGRHFHEFTLEDHHSLMAMYQNPQLSKPRSKNNYKYRCWISCAECGRKLTPELKARVICTCGHKYSNISNSVCVKCGLDSNRSSKVKKYSHVYYRCQGRKRNCTQKYLREDKIDDLIAEELKGITVVKRYYSLAVQACEQLTNGYKHSLTGATSEFEGKMKAKQSFMSELIRMRANREITSEEYLQMKAETQADIRELQSTNDPQSDLKISWKEVYLTQLKVMSKVKEKCLDINDCSIQEHLGVLGSNPTVRGEKLMFTRPFDFKAENELCSKHCTDRGRFEPNYSIEKTGPNPISEPAFSCMLAHVKSVRDKIIENTQRGNLDSKEFV